MEGPRGSRDTRRGALGLLALALLVTCMATLSACGPGGNQALARQDRARLDAEIQRAQTIGIPAAQITSIQTRETQIAAGQGSWTYSYDNAATSYTQLYHQLLGIEDQNLPVIRQRAIDNLNAFTSLLSTRHNQGFIEAEAYQVRLNQAMQQYNTAKTAEDFARVAVFAQSQTQALEAMWPAYQDLTQFQRSLAALRGAGVGVGAAQAEYEQDLTEFRSAASPDRYTHLQLVIQGQIMQLVADQAESMPYVGATMLQSFQDQIALLRQYGEDTSAFQHAYNGYASALAHAKTLADYVTIAQDVNSEEARMALPFWHGKMHYDFNQLKKLIATIATINPLLDYEYANADRGIGDVACQVADPLSWNCNEAGDNDLLTGYQDVDGRITTLEMCLRLMMDNLHDPTAPWLPHQTDFELMRGLGIFQGQVTVVSLREQTARVYENGKLVYWSYITTGRFERPSPPGLHWAIYKAQNIVFTPSEPVGSPLRGYVTPIHFAVLYNAGGYFLHDGWWRLGFGPGSNFPHFDPAAFNGGSHGCINFPLQNMAYYYSIVQQGSPVVLY